MEDPRKEKFVKDFVKRLLDEKAQIVDEDDDDEHTPSRRRDGFVRSEGSWMTLVAKRSKRS